MKPLFLRISGDVSLKSNLTLEEVGEILSKKLFGGLRIVLDGYSGFDENSGFSLEVSPWVRPKDGHSGEVNLDGYLVEILKIQLEGTQDITILE
jgi:hypothetical protein